MAKVMIISLGTGRGVESGIAKSMVQEVRDEPGLLEMLVSAFSFWDKFDHLKAASYFRNLRGKFDTQWQIDTSRSKEIVFKIAKQQEKYAAGGDIKDKYSDEILADLLANADRRAEEGKYDELSRETNQLASKAFPRLSSLKEKSRFPVLELA
jgi:hypothetical protein